MKWYSIELPVKNQGFIFNLGLQWIAVLTNTAGKYKQLYESVYLLFNFIYFRF